MKKFIIITLIILTSCGKDNDHQSYIVAGSRGDNIAFYELNPNIILDFYDQDSFDISFDIQIEGKTIINIGATTIFPYNNIAEVECIKIDTSRFVDSFPNVPVYYIYATGNVKPHEETDIISNSGIWTNLTWTSQISMDRRNGWNIGEKKYIGFRYRKNDIYFYGWIGIIIDDSTRLSVDDYAFQIN